MSAKGFISSLLVALAAFPVAVSAKTKAPARHGKVVLVGFTGPEDAARLTAPYRHAVIMQRTGRLEAVAIVIYGKAVRGLSRTGQVPPELDALIRDAHAAGIPIYVCEQALKKAGIAPADVRPEATRVPSGAAKIAQLVSEGFSPLQY